MEKMILFGIPRAQEQLIHDTILKTNCFPSFPGMRWASIRELHLLSVIWNTWIRFVLVCSYGADCLVLGSGSRTDFARKYLETWREPYIKVTELHHEKLFKAI